MSEPLEVKKPKKWREALKVFAVVIPYLVPLFWLEGKTGYPDSLGVHITAHGKAGLIERWWYSYLLVERGGGWDLALFAYMWLPIIGFAGWLIWTTRKERLAKID